VPRFVVLEEVSYHVRSNEATENVHDRRQQCFKRLTDRLRSVPPDNRRDVQVNAVAIDPELLQQRVLGLRGATAPDPTAMYPSSPTELVRRSDTP
jgi:hypothetical protein